MLKNYSAHARLVNCPGLLSFGKLLAGKVMVSIAENDKGFLL
jgi:hypothetical protein